MLSENDKSKVPSEKHVERKILDVVRSRDSRETIKKDTSASTSESESKSEVEGITDGGGQFFRPEDYQKLKKSREDRWKKLQEKYTDGNGNLNLKQYEKLKQSYQEMLPQLDKLSLKELNKIKEEFDSSIYVFDRISKKTKDSMQGAEYGETSKNDTSYKENLLQSYAKLGQELESLQDNIEDKLSERDPQKKFERARKSLYRKHHSFKMMEKRLNKEVKSEEFKKILEDLTKRREDMKTDFDKMTEALPQASESDYSLENIYAKYKKDFEADISDIGGVESAALRRYHMAKATESHNEAITALGNQDHMRAMDAISGLVEEMSGSSELHQSIPERTESDWFDIQDQIPKIQEILTENLPKIATALGFMKKLGGAQDLSDVERRTLGAMTSDYEKYRKLQEHTYQFPEKFQKYLEQLELKNQKIRSNILKVFNDIDTRLKTIHEILTNHSEIKASLAKKDKILSEDLEKMCEDVETLFTDLKSTALNKSNQESLQQHTLKMVKWSYHFKQANIRLEAFHEILTKPSEIEASLAKKDEIPSEDLKKMREDVETLVTNLDFIASEGGEGLQGLLEKRKNEMLVEMLGSKWEFESAGSALVKVWKETQEATGKKFIESYTSNNMFDSDLDKLKQLLTKIDKQTESLIEEPKIFMRSDEQVKKRTAISSCIESLEYKDINGLRKALENLENALSQKSEEGETSFSSWFYDNISKFFDL